MLKSITGYIALFAVATLTIVNVATATEKAIGKAALKFSLQDQYKQTWSWEKHWQGKPVVLIASDWRGNDYVSTWTTSLVQKLESKASFVAMADVSLAPEFLHDMLREKFREAYKNSILLDWEGSVMEHYMIQPGFPNILFIDATGTVRLHTWGKGQPEHIDAFVKEVVKLCP